MPLIVAEQARTVSISIYGIMRDPNFARGLADIRAGKPFDPNGSVISEGRQPGTDAWAYERGRLFGAIAPLTMPLEVDGEINPKALRLCEAAFTRRLVI